MIRNIKSHNNHFIQNQNQLNKQSRNIPNTMENKNQKRTIEYCFRTQFQRINNPGWHVQNPSFSEIWGWIRRWVPVENEECEEKRQRYQRNSQSLGEAHSPTPRFYHGHWRRSVADDCSMIIWNHSWSSEHCRSSSLQLTRRRFALWDCAQNVGWWNWLRSIRRHAHLMLMKFSKLIL